jgi:hypothetical protein
MVPILTHITLWQNEHNEEPNWQKIRSKITDKLGDLWFVKEELWMRGFNNMYSVSYTVHPYKRPKTNC